MKGIEQYAYPDLEVGDQDYRWCHKYAHDVVTGKIIAGKWVKLACKRHLKDLKRKDLYFDVEAAKSIVLWFKFVPITDGKQVGNATELYPWQIFLVCNLIAWKVKETGLRKYKYAYVQVARKGGKALALDTPIMTPDGYSTMGELTVGDTIYGADGKPTKITFESEVFIDHDCFEIEFSNGEKIIADADHLWETTARVNEVGAETNKGYKLKDGESSLKRVRTTRELFETQRYGIRNDANHSIDVAKPIRHTNKKLPIDPYLLGVWLGDGASSGTRIFCHTDDVDFLTGEATKSGYFYSEPKQRKTCFEFSLYHPDTPRKADSLGRFKNKLKPILRDLNLLDNKHIPEIYLLGSVAQRTSLLQGLMDTDGYIDKRGRIEFTQKSKKLSYQVYELLCSLGIKASIRSKKATCNGVDAGIVYRVNFCCNKKDIKVFRMPRKLDRMINGNATNIKQRSKTIQITNIKQVASVPTKCIQVDNDDHLFLCGKTNIPTHNTTLTGGLTLYLMYKSGYFRPRAYAAATKKDQAKLLWSDAKSMIKLSPRLSSVFKARANDILLPSLNGEFKPLASDSNSLDGLNPLVAALDECHAIKDYNLYDVLISAFGAQDEGLMITITTAGTILDGICRDLNSEGKSVLSGEIKYDSYFYLIYEIDTGDEWDEERNWYKANPALGFQPKLEYIRDQATAASMSAAKKSNFMTKHLNVFVSGADKWLNIDEVMACRNRKLKLSDYKGRKCTAAIDRSLVNDITSICLLFPNDNAGADFFFINMLPRNAVKNATKQLKNTYLKAIDGGDLEIVEGAMIRNSHIGKTIKQIHEDFDVELFGYDPYKMKELAMTMEEEFGIELISVSQGVGNMSEPTNKMEMLIKDKNMAYNDDLFEFACKNALQGVTKMNNVCIFRENVQTEKIDPLIASVIALSCATLHKVEKNPYETYGLA